MTKCKVLTRLAVKGLRRVDWGAWRWWWWMMLIGLSIVWWCVSMKLDRVDVWRRLCRLLFMKMIWTMSEEDKQVKDVWKRKINGEHDITHHNTDSDPLAPLIHLSSHMAPTALIHMIDWLICCCVPVCLCMMVYWYTHLKWVYSLFASISDSKKTHITVCRFVRNQAVISSALHTTRPQSGLMEFFDNKDNWAAKHVKVGKINFAVIYDSLTQFSWEMKCVARCNITADDIHCISKIVPAFKLSVTLSNLNRFSKFLHCWKAYEICYTTHTWYNITHLTLRHSVDAVLKGSACCSFTCSKAQASVSRTSNKLPEWLSEWLSMQFFSMG